MYSEAKQMKKSGWQNSAMNWLFDFVLFLCCLGLNQMLSKLNDQGGFRLKPSPVGPTCSHGTNDSWYGAWVRGWTLS